MVVHVDSGLPDEQLIEDYFRINVTIPLLDDVLGSLQIRYEERQENVMKGIMLLPSSTISETMLLIHSTYKVIVMKFLLGSRETIVEAIMAREMGRKMKASETAAHCINWRGHAP